MLETIIVLLIVGVALAYAGRGLWRNLAGLLGWRSSKRQGACACASAGASCGTCPLADPHAKAGAGHGGCH
jgi:hypothetical protein